MHIFIVITEWRLISNLNSLYHNASKSLNFDSEFKKPFNELNKLPNNYALVRIVVIYTIAI